MSFQNIPAELQQLNQWVCWRYEERGGRRTKVPYSPDGAHKANVHNPATWGTFAQAVSGSMHPSFNGIGLMLTDYDPYTGIDIDDKIENPASEREREVHQRILDQFQAYTELSVGDRWVDQTGNSRGGFHIIVRGKIPGGEGRDRGHVGVYSSKRYLTFSGLVVRNAPIVNCQDLLNQLVAQMPINGARDELYDIEGVLDDEEVHQMALEADNGTKYHELCRGDWQAMGYPSQSEADLALLSILAFYTRDNTQVKRLFRYTALGKREKATVDETYLNRTLKIIRSHEPAPVDFAMAQRSAQKILDGQQSLLRMEVLSTENQISELEKSSDLSMEETLAEDTGEPLTIGRLDLPPGLIGELAAYLYGAAIRPVPEIALCTAIGLLAGIVGRSYNISNTGLNHYLLFVGRTGAGKEGIASGINTLISQVQPLIPMASEFIGPAAFASGQGLIRTLDKKPCFVSILGEFGLTLQALSDPRAPAAQVILRKVLLDLYGKSGWTSMLHSTAYSDIEKNTKIIHAPSVSILGETTPHTFFDKLDVEDIADGLIPRFHIVEYTGERPARNPNANAKPSDALIQRLADLITIGVGTHQNRTCAAVGIASDALAILDGFDTSCDRKINKAGSSGEAQLWNRAHLKALKLAGLIAVGCNPHAPVVSKNMADWAIEFTTRGTKSILRKFESSEIGNGNSRQMADVKIIIRDYFKMDSKQQKSYQVKGDWGKAGCIPFSYLQTRTSNLASFKHDRAGASRALKQSLADLEDAGLLVKLHPNEVKMRFNSRRVFYALGEDWIP